MEVSWPGDYGEIHTRILERMRQVLSEDTEYPYLKPNARTRLSLARHVAANTRMLEIPLVHLGGYSFCLFPWLGTRSFRTLRKLLQRNATRFSISGIEYEGCYYIKFKMPVENRDRLLLTLAEEVRMHGIDCESLVATGEIPVFEKYDDYVPAELLRHAYAVDKLDGEEAGARLLTLAGLA